MRTALVNDDSVVYDGDPIALPFAPPLSTRNCIIAAGSAVQVFSSGSDSITWAQQATPQSSSVVVPQGSSLTFFYALGVWYVVAEGSVPAAASVTSYNGRTGAVTSQLSDVGVLFGAKGQIIAGTGAGTADLVPASATSGQVLTVGGADPSGLEWVTPTVTPTPTTIAPGWTLKSPANLISPVRGAAGISFDTTNHLTYVFGGISYASVTLSDTWKWDGTTWTQLSPSTTPPARSGHGMCWYPSSALTVMFGGTTNNGVTLIQTTYTFNGTNWTLKSPATKPTSRAYFAMCNYDAGTSVILFGGYNGSSNLNDTWSWNGTTWTAQSPLASPAARDNHAMAYDPNTQNIVLFGGQTTTTVGDTWLYNGLTWMQVNPLNAPSARSGHSMAYDASTGHVMLQGGNDINGNPLGDMWMFVNNDWVSVPTGTTPPNQPGNQDLVYDVTRANLVLTGSDTSGQTWTFTPATGSPTTGTWVEGQEYIDTNGIQYVCILGGTNLAAQWAVAPPSVLSAYGPVFRVGGAPGTSIATATFTTVIPTSVAEDTMAGWNSTTGVYTFKAAGIYDFWAVAQWPSLGSGAESFMQFISGAANWNITNNFIANSGPDIYGRQVLSGSWRFAVDDQLYLQVWQSSGSSQVMQFLMLSILWRRP